jgi:hypothetical protein
MITKKDCFPLLRIDNTLDILTAANWLSTPHLNNVHQHLRKAILTLQRDWNERLSILLLLYRAPVHETTGMTPNSMVFQKELCLPFTLLVGVMPTKRQCMTDYMRWTSWTGCMISTIMPINI